MGLHLHDSFGVTDGECVVGTKGGGYGGVPALIQVPQILRMSAPMIGMSLKFLLCDPRILDLNIQNFSIYKLHIGDHWSARRSTVWVGCACGRMHFGHTIASCGVQNDACFTSNSQERRDGPWLKNSVVSRSTIYLAAWLACGTPDVSAQGLH